MNDSPVYMFKSYPGLLWIFQPNQVSPLPLLRKAISCEWGLDREYSPDFKALKLLIFHKNIKPAVTLNRL